MMFDTATRRGFWISAEQLSNPRQFVWACIHEMGHQLNLPHPWQAYGDTRSVMSFGWRWDDWSWSDPSIYRFDDFGANHIMFGPEQYVRPGGSAFLDYGGPKPWEAGGRTTRAHALTRVTPAPRPPQRRPRLGTVTYWKIFVVARSS